MSTVKEKVAKPVVAGGLSIAFCIGKVGLKIPFTRKKILKKFMYLSKANEEEDFKDTLFKRDMYKSLLKQTVIDVTKTVKLNRTIPNLSLIKLTVPKTNIENEVVKMFDMQRKGVPLVLNFGSCS